MANKNKAKGYYHERRILEWLQARGFKAKRQPLSGALGGEYRGDLKIEVAGRDLVGEIKYRDKSNFPSPFAVLEGRDLAIYKRRSGTPQMIVVMTTETFEFLMERNNGNRNPE